MPEKKPFERLPKDVIPVNYVLRLQPDLKGFTFDGHEEIAVKVMHINLSNSVALLSEPTQRDDQIAVLSFIHVKSINFCPSED